jgi:hypothetical protein
MQSEKDITLFAERLYQQFIENFQKNKQSPFLLLTADAATSCDCPGINSSNLRNVLLGGRYSGSATFSE